MVTFLVLLTVVIQIINALLLDYASEYESIFHFTALLLIAVAFCNNFLRFLLWSIIHKKFEISRSYPLIASFFPLIYIISLIKGETDFSITKTVGVVLIVSGMAILQSTGKREKENRI